VIAQGTRIAIVAGRVSGFVGAASIGRVARVEGARAAVVAGEVCRSGQANAGQANIPEGAKIAVAARRGGGSVYAPGEGVARVHGARIEVVAIHRLPETDSAGADVPAGARIRVIAGPVYFLMQALSSLTVAAIKGAGIAVEAVFGRSGTAHPGGTRIPLGAGVAVVTGRLVEQEDAPRLRVATIVSTWIQVVTNRQFAAGADALMTRVAQGAGVVIVAGQLIRRLAYALARIGCTRVRRTYIAVIADLRYSGLAFSFLALVAARTKVAVIAGHTVNRLLQASLVG